MKKETVKETVQEDGRGVVLIRERDGGHGLLFQDPKDIASRILSFLNPD